MLEVQIWCLYLVHRLLYSVLPETTFFDKNGRTWPQFDLYNFWPWVTSDKIFSEDAWNWCPERYWKFQSAIPNRIWVIGEKPTGGALWAPPPLIRSRVKARRTIYKMTLKGQGQSLTSGQVRSRSHDDWNGSYCISLDSPGQDERTDTNPTSLSLFDQKLLANDGWWPRVTSNDLSRGRQCNFLLELFTTVLYDMIPLK